MIDSKTVYGVEFYSQDHMQPGFILTFTGEEIKKLMAYLKKDMFVEERGGSKRPLKVSVTRFNERLG